MEMHEMKEQKFKVKFTQSAKGNWQAKYVVRADTLAEVESNCAHMRNYVNGELKYLNFKNQVLEGITHEKQ